MVWCGGIRSSATHSIGLWLGCAAATIIIDAAALSIFWNSSLGALRPEPVIFLCCTLGRGPLICADLGTQQCACDPIGLAGPEVACGNTACHHKIHVAILPRESGYKEL